MKTITTFLCSSLAASWVLTAQADISIFEWAINKDGVITGVGDALPPGSAFDTSTGLGTVTLSFSGAGLHSSIFYVDHEISEAVNTFFNELGLAGVGAPSAGQSWEIDEPGFSASPGDIFDNFLANTLDNMVGKATPDDVAMALGWDFVIGVGETATVTYTTSLSEPRGGFYLKHVDPDSDEAVYFTSNLRIERPNTVPDGTCTAALLLATLLGMCGRATKP